MRSCLSDVLVSSRIAHRPTIRQRLLPCARTSNLIDDLIMFTDGFIVQRLRRTSKKCVSWKGWQRGGRRHGPRSYVWSYAHGRVHAWMCIHTCIHTHWYTHTHTYQNTHTHNTNLCNLCMHPEKNIIRSARFEVVTGSLRAIAYVWPFKIIVCRYLLFGIFVHASTQTNIWFGNKRLLISVCFSYIMQCTQSA